MGMMMKGRKDGASTKKPPFRKRGVGGINPTSSNTNRPPIPHHPLPSFPPHTVIPAPIVIPAKAGIHPPAISTRRDIPGFWIPAGAGMTVGDAE